MIVDENEEFPITSILYEAILNFLSPIYETPQRILKQKMPDINFFGHESSAFNDGRRHGLTSTKYLEINV